MRSLIAGMTLVCAAAAHGQECDPQDLFAPQVLYATDEGPMAVAIGDLDGDGDADLATSNRWGSPASVSVLLNHGDGTFSAHVVIEDAGDSGEIAIGDLDGDGDADLVVPDSTGDYVDVMLGNGDGSFAPAVAYDTGELVERQTAAADSPDADADALNVAAWELLTHEVAELRDLPYADRACAGAEASGDSNLWSYLDTLALAQHMTDDTAEAIETQKRAIALAPDDEELKVALTKYEDALAAETGATDDDQR